MEHLTPALYLIQYSAAAAGEYTESTMQHIIMNLKNYKIAACDHDYTHILSD